MAGKVGPVDASGEPKVCTCRHDSGASTDCDVHYPAAAAVPSSPAQEPEERLWRAIYDGAANEGSILHDDTVTAIAKSIAALPPSSPVADPERTK